MRLSRLLPADIPTALVVLLLHSGCRGWGGGHCDPEVATDSRVHTYGVVTQPLGWDQGQSTWLERGAGFSSYQDMSLEGFLRAHQNFAREQGLLDSSPLESKKCISERSLFTHLHATASSLKFLNL